MAKGMKGWWPSIIFTRLEAAWCIAELILALLIQYDKSTEKQMRFSHRTAVKKVDLDRLHNLAVVVS